MHRTIVIRWVTAILLGAAIAPVTPAMAQVGGATTQDRGGAQARAADHDQIVLRRDGDRAVPFEVGTPAARADEGFHWGDALIGAAGGYALVVLASGALVLIRRRRPPRHLAERPA